MNRTLLLALLLFQDNPKDPYWLVRDCGDGMRLMTRDFENLYESRQTIAMVEVDVPGATRARVVRASEKTSSVAQRTNAAAALAVGFFDDKGNPVAPLKAEGTLHSKGLPAWPAVAALVLGNEKEKIKPVIRRVAKEDDLKSARHAIGGIPLVEGKKVVDGLDAWPDDLKKRQARTLVGLSESGKRFHAVAIQGGDGFTLAECARFLADLGYDSGMAVGGGTVTLCAAARRDWVVNAAKEEAVAGAALVLQAPVIVIVDNADPDCKPGDGWTAKTEGKGFFGKDYLFHAPGKGEVVYTPFLAFDGTYEVFVQYPVTEKAGSVSAHLDTADGERTVASIAEHKNGGGWFSIGTYRFAAGGGKVRLEVVTQIGWGVVADAVRFRQKN